MEEKILQLEKVSVEYGGIQALNAIDFSIQQGEIVALLGPNGAGKSTVLKVIAGLVPASGRFRFHGNFFQPVAHEMPALGIAFVAQGRRVFPRLTVREHFMVGGGAPILATHVEESLQLFPILRKKWRSAAGMLSGGEQQMLALARGVAAKPQLFLLDEPSLGLAPKVVHEVFAKIQEIHARHHTAFIIVEHNLRSLISFAHRAYLFERGSVAATGTTCTVFEGDAFQRVFFGK